MTSQSCQNNTKTFMYKTLWNVNWNLEILFDNKGIYYSSAKVLSLIGSIF